MTDNLTNISELLPRAAAKYPERVAIEDMEDKLTYAQLSALCDTVAASIDALGAPRENPVAVFLPKGRYYAAAQLGILRAGRFYVPLDYTEAGERLSVMLETLDCGLIITDIGGAEILRSLGVSPEKLAIFKQLAAGEAHKAPDVAIAPGDSACIMFTSGSTGKPKGVVLTHAGIVDFARFYVSAFGIDHTDTIALQAPFHFDAVIIDLYSALLAGARFLVIPEILLRYPDKLMDYLEENKVTRLFLIPSIMITMSNAGVVAKGRLPLVKSVCFGGEVMHNKSLNIWRAAMPQSVFANLYGPTETTVACTYYIADRPFEDEAPLPIGVPCPNKGVLILDEDGNEAAPGETGELCILGVGLASGYWREPEISAKAFVPNPLDPSERMYKSGDVASRGADGLVMFHGRLDEQVKINGIRIELGDVESAARKVWPSERVCAVFDDENKEIVLCVETDEDVTLRKFNMKLRSRIPSYMLPKKLVTVSEFPKRSSGKVDKQALKKIVFTEGK